MSFRNILNKSVFKTKICAQCKLCSNSLYNADFCFPTFLANKTLFMEQFVYKVIYTKNLSGNAANISLRRPAVFKLMFCSKPGACINAGQCSRDEKEDCYINYYNQLTGMKFDEVSDDGYMMAMLGESIIPRTTDAFLDYIEENRNNRKSKNESFESDIIDAQYEELTTTKDEPEDGPMVLSSERKKFLSTVEGILANRNSQQYRIRKSPEPLKAKAAGKAHNSKSAVSVGGKGRKKDLGNSKTNKSG